MEQVGSQNTEAILIDLRFGEAIPIKTYKLNFGL